MAQMNISSTTIQDLRNHAVQLDVASDRIHELTGIFEFILHCGNWEVEQAITTTGSQKYLDLVERRADATDDVLRLAVSVLLGPAADAIHKTKKSIEEITASRP